MSTLRVDQITDEEGTGAPDFPNGIEVAGGALAGLANQAEAEAGTDNTKLMTPLRTAQAIAELSPAPSELTQTQVEDSSSTVFGTVSGERLAQAVAANLPPPPSGPTTSQVLSALSGASVDAVGMFQVAWKANTGNIASGSTTSGGNLGRASGGQMFERFTNTSMLSGNLSGSWRCIAGGTGRTSNPGGGYFYHPSLWLRIS